MEIASLSLESIRMKGKTAGFIINPMDKSAKYDGAVVFYSDKKKLKIDPEAVVIEGAGDYEVGGVKVAAIRYENDLVFSFLIDDISILLIEVKALAKNHQKLRDYNLVIVYMDSEGDISSAVNFAGSAVLYFGEKAAESAKLMIKEGLVELNKYVITKDKLPVEVAQILLV